MFGFLKSKKVAITQSDMIKLMPADKNFFEGLAFDEDIPRNLYKVSDVNVTIKRQTVQRKLVHCRDTVKALVAQLKKKQATVYYVAPEWFKLELADVDGSRVRCSARFDITPDTSTGLVDWLELNVKTPGEGLSIEVVAALLSGKGKPDWLEIKDAEQIAEPTPETSGDTEAVEEQTVNSLAVGGPPVFGRYQIERELGAGGMGRVFLALDTQTTIEARRRVVLKVLHLENAHDLKSQEQFKKEADTLADMRNDRIAACYNSRMLGDVPILVMEYVEGISLDEYLEEHDGKLDEATTIDLLLPMAEALDYAHKKKIYHLDVKPQNIIVRKTPKMGIKTCLLDFGIARKAHADGSMTFTMSVAGTAPYMSPDQLSGDTPSAAMDIYSLAVTAYECLTGRRPYPYGWKPSQTVAPIESETPLALSIMAGLSSDPTRRPESCVALLNPSPLRFQKKKILSTERPEKTERQDYSGQEVKIEVAGEDDLLALEKSFANYRMMLAQSANRCARDNAERAEWMRRQQASLRDLTKDLQQTNEGALVRFFNEVKNHIAEKHTTADDFFVETVRLVELRNGLPKAGDRVWLALKESIA